MALTSYGNGAPMFMPTVSGGSPQGMDMSGGGGGMDPMSMFMAFGGGGAGILGSILNAFSANKQLKQQNDQFNAQLGANQQQSMAAALSSFLSNQMTQANMGLASTQMNPYAQAGFRNSANIKRTFGQQYGGAHGLNFDLSALDPANLDKNADYFYKSAAAANPTVPVGDVSPNAEAFRTGAGGPLQSQTDTQGQIKNFLQGMSGSANDPYAAVKNIYNEVTGGKYTPSQAELTQFGANIDSNYLNKIRNTVANWWAQQPGSRG